MLSRITSRNTSWRREERESYEAIGSQRSFAMETAKLPRDIVNRVERRWMLRHTQLLQKLHGRFEGMQPVEKELRELPVGVVPRRETAY
jgi:hypothetical protein